MKRLLIFIFFVLGAFAMSAYAQSVMIMSSLINFHGGSWIDIAKDCRVSNRNNNTPSNRNCYLGFRVVLLP